MRKIFAISFLGVLALVFAYTDGLGSHEKEEKGSFAIYFMQEMVGYEEYTFQSDEKGYLLSVKGRMTKPIALEIETLILRLDRNFIPSQYHFKGSVSGVQHEILSAISEGQVENTIIIAGQEQKNSVKIKRDAFLLPNPIYSPFLILTKKFRCSLQEKTELSAYIVPQFEVTFSLEPKEEDSCWLAMNLAETEVELETDSDGKLKALHIPSRNLEVIHKDS